MGNMGKIISFTILIDVLGMEIQEVVYSFGFIVFCFTDAKVLCLVYCPVIFARS